MQCLLRLQLKMLGSISGTQCIFLVTLVKVRTVSDAYERAIAENCQLKYHEVIVSAIEVKYYKNRPHAVVSAYYFYQVS